MSENFSNKIKTLELENFTCFSKIKLDFSSGINVLIGENGTGKTHILKVLYALLRKSQFRVGTLEEKQFDIGNNFIEIFKIAHGVKLNDLIRNKKEGSYSAELFFDERYTENKFASIKQSFISPNQNKIYSSKGFETELIHRNLLYIPTQEMLSLYKGFIAAYEKRENGFDGTYYDLAKALNGNQLKNKDSEEIKALTNDLENAVNVNVLEKNNEFYIQSKDTGLEIEANLSAEGIKKLSQMIYLTQNGSLTKETILFWDEPEVNLNPRYIRVVAKYLQTLAKNGVQIFVATHDYLLAHLLSLDAEYRVQTSAPPMKFFSFYKEENGTAVESADTLAQIENNVLLDEYAAYYELEQTLFKQTLETI